MKRKHILPLLLLLGLFAGRAQAQFAVSYDKTSQTYMADPMKNAYTVEEISVSAAIKDQMSDVTVSQVIMNPNASTMEVEIFFPLPNEAAIQNFMLMVDNQEISGKLMKKEEARAIYEGIVRAQKDPALMEYAGTGLFKTSVFPIPAGQKRTITVRYSQLLPKKFENILFTYPFATQKFSAHRLKKVRFNASIETREKLGNVFSPSDAVNITRRGNHTANISFETENTIPDHDLRLHYSYTSSQVGVTLYSHKPRAGEDGYFMLLASPAEETGAKGGSNKSIVFVIDQSGSMGGQKIEQAKKALRFCLENLKEGDLFNIVHFDDQVRLFQPELQRCNSETQRQAYAFVSSLQPGGGTNINDAVVRGMNLLPESSLPSYLIFLTDGEATSGVTDELTIARNCKAANRHQTRLFAFGIGTGVNARLLDRLSSENGGLSEFVSNDAELESKVSGFYSQIAEPAMARIKINVEGTDVDQTYPADVPDIFQGGQLVWVGRYRRPGSVKITIKGIAGGKEQTLTHSGRLTGDTTETENAFVEKTWATKRIGHIMQQIDLNGQNPELVNTLVALSTRYGILTPYTAYLSREDADFRNTTLNVQATQKDLTKLEEKSGAQANALRKINNGFKAAKAAPERELADASIGTEDLKAAGMPAPGAGTAMLSINSKTFYLRNGNYVESTLSEKEEKAAIRVKRLSKEYFDLARQNNNEVNTYLSRDEKIIFRAAGNVYLIE